MEDPRGGKDAEVEQSGAEIRPRQAVEEADEHEGNYVLYVILVTPGQKKKKHTQ